MQVKSRLIILTKSFRVKLTVDCVLTPELSSLPSNSALAQLLSKGFATPIQMHLESPLEALICRQYGLQARPDYPIAAMCAVADGLDLVDGLVDADNYWLRADPVYLVLQRDCFSLHEAVPLSVDATHAKNMVASLNQHFNQDGLTFLIGNSGAWYLRTEQNLDIKTTLPSVVAGKNIHQFMPQGFAASKWLAVLNEVQMLLFEHPANIARESLGELAVNSIWLSGGGKMPQVLPLLNNVDAIFADSIFYQGLAKLAGVPFQAVPSNLTDVLNHVSNHVLNQQQLSARLQLPNTNTSVWFEHLLAALKTKKIKQLTLNLGFYEKSLIVNIKPLDTYKFWRSNKPVMDYLQ